jgi:hypothetical protein
MFTFDATVNDGVESNIIRLVILIFLHQVEDLEDFANLIVLRVGFDHRSVQNCVHLDVVSRELFIKFERLFKIIGVKGYVYEHTVF